MNARTNPPMLDVALALIADGFHVTPLHGKRPYLDRWPERAINTENGARAHWAMQPTDGLGVVGGMPLPGGGYLALIDLDEKNGVSGGASFRQWCAEHGVDTASLPKSRSVQTPNRGSHIYLRTPEPVQTRGGVLPGLDIRGKGGQCVAPGVVIDGYGAYAWVNDAPIAECPAALLPLFTQARNDGATPEQRGKALSEFGPLQMKSLASAVRFLAQQDGFADAYGTWFDTGIGLASLKGTDFENEALELFHEFSATSSKYDSAVVYAKWGNDLDARSATPKCIIYDAEQLGWSDPVQPRERLQEVFPLGGGEPAPWGESLESRLKWISEAHPEDIQQKLLPAFARTELAPVAMDALKQAICKRLSVKAGVLNAQLQHLRGQRAVGDRTIAEMVLQQIGTENIAKLGTSGVYVWDGMGVWNRIPPGASGLHPLINAEVGEKIDSGKTMASVATLLTAMLPEVSDDTLEAALKANELRVNCPNGELMLNEATGEWVLRPHERESYFLNRIAVPYDPNATAPEFEKALRGMFAGALDVDLKVARFVELMGYTLLRTCRFEMIVYLSGEGANGKSTLLRVLMNLLGPANYTAVHPDKLGEEFLRAQLHGKLANIVTEVGANARVPDQAFKVLASGEPSTVSEKNRPQFLLRPYATLWMAANSHPHVIDQTRGFWRKISVFSFPHNFEGAKDDTSLKAKLEAELPGILTMALQAIGGAWKRGKLTDSPSVAQATADWQTSTDQAAGFAADCLDLSNPAASERSDAVYTKYRLWAKEEGNAYTLGRKALATRLKRFGIHTMRAPTGHNLLCGLRLRAANEGPGPGTRGPAVNPFD
jgi:P4 family phage/plasmid primase-like protien